jgi:hypothetical protein
MGQAVEAEVLNCPILDDKMDRLTRNVDKLPPIYAAQDLAKIYFTPWWMPEIKYVKKQRLRGG